MINSNHRKLLLSGWLKHNGSAEYDSPLKHQKFLLFYEAFMKINGYEADFSHLKGYKHGPVFSNVWGDYTYERAAFDDAVERAYSASPESINSDLAQKSLFTVSVLSAKELSELTHKLNLWKSKQARIEQGERQVELSESDFNCEDAEIIRKLCEMHPMSLINDSHVIEIDNHYFVFNRHDASRLTEQHIDVLTELADKEELHNPVYVDIDEEGRLVVD